jgi:hypothetical protein
MNKRKREEQDENQSNKHAKLDDYMNRKNTWLQRVKKWAFDLKNTDEDLKNDLDIVLAATNTQIMSFQYAGNELKDNKELVLELVKKHGTVIQFASDRLRHDRDIVVAAIQESYCFDIVRYIHPELQQDKNILLAAISHCMVTCFIHEDLLQDREWALTVIRIKPWYLESFPHFQGVGIRGCKEKWQCIKICQ